MSSMLVIVPTRKRPEQCDQLLKAFQETALISDIVFGIDDDDDSQYSDAVKDRAHWAPRLRMGGTLNLIAQKNADKYKWLAFMGDDHRPRTKAWDLLLAAELKGDPGIAYGNDLLQGGNLPTACVMSSDIVQKIGYMVPPTLIHMYMDNFWLDMGRALGNLRYREDVVIEHLHPLAGKAAWDESYKETNAENQYSQDAMAYHSYKSVQFGQDVRKILGI